MSFSFENQQIIQLLLSLGLGCFLGIRRELDQLENNYTSFMGIRTMAILCAFGTISTFIPILPFLPIVIFSGIFLLVLVAYIYNTFIIKRVGMTSEIVALMVYWIGVLVGTEKFVLAILITIFLGIINEFRDDIHKFIKTLTHNETKGALKLLIISGAMLPFLPQVPIDPWGLIIPFKIWLLVILISGIGFLGYFLSKYFSQKGGTLLAAFLGSIVSSTAVTASLAEQSKRIKTSRILAAGILLGMAIMQIRVFIEIILVGDIEFKDTFLFVPLSMAAASIIACLRITFYKSNSKKEPTKKDFQLSSPFDLIPALKFGIVFVAILLVLYFAKKFLGNTGVYIAAGLSGIVDVDAIVLSSLESARNNELTYATSKGAITIALVVNTLIKIGYVGVLGSKKLLKKIIGSTIFVGASGIIAFFLT